MANRIIETGVIAAAGKGTRAYPRTSFIPKPLFRIEGQSLLERNAEIQFKYLKVKKLYVLVGHLKEQVEEEVERLKLLWPKKHIEAVFWTTKGLASDVASLRDKIDGNFSLILGDEFYYKSDHSSLLKSWNAHKKSKGIIAIWPSPLVSTIRKNYSVELQKDKVLNLIEKPENPPNELAGLGTYIFSPEYFDYFDKTPESKKSGVKEITDVIDFMARDSKEVYAQNIGGRYFNINSLADYYTVNYHLRSDNFKKYKVSLVIPTLDNPKTLPDVVADFKSEVDEIVVADLGTADKKSLPKAGPKLQILHYPLDEKNGRYNAQAIYDAMGKTKGDIIVLAPADGSFRARDLPKLLEYLKDCDLAIGTRTTRQLMEQGSNLKPFYRWLNVALGKMVEILWWGQEPRFTDVGCTYRAIWKPSFETIREELKSQDKAYSVEMMVEIVRYHMRCIEVPVSYYQRYGDVPEVASRWELWRYFFSIMTLMFTRKFAFLERIRSLFSRK